MTSFLLINFWNSKISTLRSAFKAFAFNKVSDAALIAAACLGLWQGSALLISGATSAAALAAKLIVVSPLTVTYNDVFVACLCVAAFCKSAQLGFHL